MYARLAACVCRLLLSLAIFSLPSFAAAAEPGSGLLNVYLKSDGGTPTAILDQMKLQMDVLMRAAGYSVEWQNPHMMQGAPGHLVVVEFKGGCGGPAAVADATLSDGALDGRSLGSSAVTEGHVLPFSSVDCNALNQLLDPSLSHKSPGQRDEVYGRAIARVLAHEFYHVLAQTVEHTHEGLSKAHLSARELMQEHLEFVSTALREMRGQRAVTTAGFTTTRGLSRP
jgi:hypothetical protein